MASTDANPIPIKNTAYRVSFPILDADGDLVSGATGLDSEVSKDGGTFTDCTSEAVEIATASGMYYLDLTATEMNADTVCVIVKTTSSGGKTTPMILYPNKAGGLAVNVTAWAGSATGTGNVAIKNTLAKTTDITGFVDITAAQVNTECDTALADVGVTTTVTGRIDAAVSTRATPAQVQTELGTYGALKPTVATRTLDVSTTGEAGLDWANVGGQGTTVGLTATTIATVTNATNVTNPVALTAAYDSAKTAASQASVNTIDDFVDTEVAAIKVTTDKLDTALELDGAVYRYTTNSLEQAPTGTGGGGGATVAQIWDEPIAGHLIAGSTGAKLNASGAGGDPWTTAVPGAYAAGTAGNILGNRVDAAVTTRATPAQVQTELGTYGALKPTVAARTLDVTATGEAGVDLDNTVGTLAKGTDITGFNDLSAANIQTELATYGALKPTTAGRTLDVTATGEAGIDLDNTVGTLAKGTDITGFNDIAAGAAMTLTSGGIDSIWAKTMTELSSVPGVTASTLDAIRWIFLLARNKITQTATTQTLRNDADSANVATSTVSDDGTTFTRGEFA